MRPRKSILLVCPNEITASVLSLSMDLWNYRVTRKIHVDDAELALEVSRYDLVLLMPGRGDNREQFISSAKWIECIQSERGDRTRIFDTHKVLSGDDAGGIIRITGEVMSAELLREGIRLAMARRRGPRPVLMERAA